MCAHAVRVAVEKIPGVAEATVSLNDGRVTVSFTPGNRVDLAEVRETIRDQGFTPREAVVRLAGSVERDPSGRLRLILPGSEVRYALDGAADTARHLRGLASGSVVVLTGRIGEDRDGATPRVLFAVEIEGAVP